MRATLSLLASALLFAGAAFAEPTAPADTPAPPQATALATPKTVESLTVTGKAFPKAECAARDKNCIAMVVAELKRRYPEQLKRFCFQRQMQAMRDTVQFGGADPGGSEPTQTGLTFTPAAPLAIACAPDRK